MDATSLKSLADAARQEATIFEMLSTTPEVLIKDFEAISDKVDGAIASMSPDAALADLLASPSNSHCIRTSCGGSSFAPIS